MVKPERVAIPATGIHVLPFLSAPAILARRSEPRFVVVEMTPIDREKPTQARCQIPMTQADALKLAILIAEHALAQNWPLPEGSPIRRTIQ